MCEVEGVSAAAVTLSSNSSSHPQEFQDPLNPNTVCSQNKYKEMTQWHYHGSYQNITSYYTFSVKNDRELCELSVVLRVNCPSKSERHRSQNL